MSDAGDPYEVLGVSRNASTQQIRAAYVAKARRAHPDLVGPRGLDVMRAINEAWSILRDSSRRSSFDIATASPATIATAGPARDEAANRPSWTGAEGPPPGRPWGLVLDFGIFYGWSLGEISRRDRGYLAWLRDRPEGQPYRAEIGRLLDPDAEEPVDVRRTSRR